MKRKRMLLALCALALLALAAALCARPILRAFWPGGTKLDARSIVGAQVTERQARSVRGGLTRTERTYDLENGDCVRFGRMKAGEQESAYHLVRTDRLQSSEGTVWYLDEQTNEWIEAPLGAMEIGSTCVYIDGAKDDYFCYLPIGYEPLENNSLRYNGSRGYLSITRSLGGWSVRMFGAYLRAGEVCDYTVVTSDAEVPLLDHADERILPLWRSYANNGDGRWCYDGYYFPAAETYVPSGTGCLYRCVAAYFTRSMSWQVELVRCAADLELTTLDTLSLQQNEAGYFPSMSLSTWLQSDYGIPAGYYDTRFNSDLMELYYQHMLRTGGFADVVDRYLDFYLTHAEEHHDETASGGWLVWDYNQSTVPVHCSLNHQVSEMLVLYRFGKLLDRPELEELADRMLLGLEDTGDGWLRDDGNLHYSIRSGEFGMDDYPYLTYNDLYELQQAYEEWGRSRSAVLDRLMASKLAWMQANGVTGYQS